MISIIIVHYHVDERLFQLLQSIYSTKPKHSFEIIIVDNDEIPSIEKKLHKKFPKVHYIKSGKNLGYSGGHNLGASYAKGEFLFFLNPDTVFASNILDVLVAFLKKDKHVGAAAPLLLDKNNQPYPLQGTKKLGIKEAIFALSFFNKWLPKNPISQAYWNIGWDKTQIKQVDVVPGTAFMIRKELFETIGKFDERYFLFFEEYDICRRLLEIGYKNYIVPGAKLVHFWGDSTKHRSDIAAIFAKSRFLYFQKFFGTGIAAGVEAILRFSPISLIITALVLIAAFLRFYGMDKYMLFIGDFAWFYLSAKDLLISGTIPFVGIPSSHPWIHQGALWTYMLATSLWLGNFHPVSGGYLVASIGVITTIVLYILTKEMLDKKTALFASAFFATSPLIIFHSRLPYHTAPIPLFVLLYIYALYKWVKGSKIHFVFAIFWLVILYNFELACAVLAAPFVLYIIYGIWKKASWFSSTFSPKIIFLSLVAFFVPMTPMLLHDISHGFPQTVKFAAWLGYRVLLLFGYPPLHPQNASHTYADVFQFFIKNIHEYFYLPNMYIAAVLFFASIGFFLSLVIKNIYTKHTEMYTILFLSFFIPVGIIIVSKVPSEAYLPMIFVQSSLFVGMLFSFLAGKTKPQRVVAYILFFLLCASNGISFFQSNFGTNNALPIKERIGAAEEIIQLADGSPYTLIGNGPGSQFPSFTMNYEYLTWWLGEPVEKRATQEIIIKEHEREIILYKK